MPGTLCGPVSDSTLPLPPPRDRLCRLSFPCVSSQGLVARVSLGRLASLSCATLGCTTALAAQLALAQTPQQPTWLRRAPQAPDAAAVLGSRPRVDAADPLRQGTLPPWPQQLEAPGAPALADEAEQVQVMALKPLSLAEARSLAFANNPELKASDLAVEAAEARLRASYALWYPSLDLTASALPGLDSARQWRNFKTDDPLGSVSPEPNWRYRTYRSGSAELRLQWALIDPRRVPRIAADRDALEQAGFSRLIALRQLDLDVSITYYRLQQADANVEVAAASLRSSQTRVKNNEARYAAGVVTLNDLLQSQAQLARDEALLAEARAEQNAVRRELASIINLPADITPTAADPNLPLGSWTASLQDSIIASNRNREELKRFLSAISENNSLANVQLAAIQPSLRIFNVAAWNHVAGQAGWGDTVGPDWLSTETWTNRVGLSLAWRLYDGGEARASAKRLRLEAERQAQLFAAARNRFRRDVERAFFALQADRQSILALAREVVANREALRLTMLRNEAGVGTEQDVIDRQRDLTQSSIRHASSIADYNINIATLQRYTGLDAVSPCLPADRPAAEPPEGLPPVPLQAFEAICGIGHTGP